MAKIIKRTSSGAVALSPNFYLSDFTTCPEAVRLGIDNTPDPLAVQSLFKLAALMEKVRLLLGGKQITVYRGFCSPAVNDLMGTGGELTLDYLRGESCDFSCMGFGNTMQVAAAITKSSIKHGGISVMGDAWVQITLPVTAP